MGWQDAPLVETKAAWMSAPEVTTAKPSFMQNVGTMVGNIPKSAANFAGGIVDAAMHPIDTASGLADIAVGGATKLMPQSFLDWSAKQANPQQAANMQRAGQSADAVGQFYKDRYGSLDKAGQTLINDPVGVAADASTVLGLGSAATGGKLSELLAQGSKYTNPLSAVAPVVKKTGQAAGFVGKNLLGLTTGVGAENVSQAFQSGLKGKTAFMDNMTGKVPINDVLDTAKQNLAQMRADKSTAYRSGMVDISKDKSVLDFAGVDKAAKEAAAMVSFKGQVKNAKGAEIVQKIQSAIDEWKQLDPGEFHTPEGFDALKQKVGGLVESLPFEEKSARLAANKVYHSLKTEINKQAPSYADVMGDYQSASEQISEIERALSLGDRASKDTAMRKLQSLSRNNASTNYGNRLDLAKQLEAGGGQEILPAIAGQAMSSAIPRGLVGQAGALGTAASITSNPLMAAALPFQSPAIVGAGLYGAGKAAGGAGKLIDLLKVSAPVNLTPENVRLLALLMGQSGGLAQNAQNNVGK